MPRPKPFSGKQKKAQMQNKRKEKAARAGRANADIDALFAKMEEDQDRRERQNQIIDPHEKENVHDDLNAQSPNIPEIPALGTNSSTQEERLLDVSSLPYQTQSCWAMQNSEAIKNTDDKFFLKLKKMSKQQVKENVGRAQSERFNVLRSKPHFPFNPSRIAWPNFPKRPECDVYTIGKKRLLKMEADAFDDFCESVAATAQKLNHFEHNLETWRQLWRVIEKSNCIALVADARFPQLTIPESLLEYCRYLGMPVILILNKIDLVPPETAVRLYQYYTSAKYTNLINSTVLFSCAARNLKMSMKKYNAIERQCKLGPADLLKSLPVSGEVLDWEEVVGADRPSILSQTGAIQNHENLLDHVTLGILGSPNVGKSSVMNRLVGKKITRTSITPGATKYFQTYEVSERVTLCDCPGLVFPAEGISYGEQVICGAYPISQVQEPYTIVGLLSRNSDVVSELKLDRHKSLQKSKQAVADPLYDSDDESLQLSSVTAWEICEKYALNNGYFVGKSAGKVDVYRGANEILRRVLRGDFNVFTGFEEGEALDEKCESLLEYLGGLKALEKELLIDDGY